MQNNFDKTGTKKHTFYNSLLGVMARDGQLEKQNGEFVLSLDGKSYDFNAITDATVRVMLVNEYAARIRRDAEDQKARIDQECDELLHEVQAALPIVKETGK